MVKQVADTAGGSQLGLGLGKAGADVTYGAVGIIGLIGLAWAGSGVLMSLTANIS